MPTIRLLSRYFFALLIAVTAHAALAAYPVAKIALQAKLFNGTSGTFSTDVLLPGAAELVNVVARDDPSNSTFVIVAVTLADGKVVPSDSRVRLVARELATRTVGTRKPSPARTVIDKTVQLGSVTKGGVTHLGFWLSDTGCRPVQLKATLTVARQPISISTDALIPFVCAE